MQLHNQEVFVILFTRVLNSIGLKLTFMPSFDKSSLILTPVASLWVFPAFVKSSNSTLLTYVYHTKDRLLV